MTGCPKIFTQGRWKVGKFGKTDDQLKTTPATGGTPHMAMDPPQPGHHMTGKIVLLPSLVVVSQVFVEVASPVMISADASGGTVIMVEEIVKGSGAPIVVEDWDGMTMASEVELPAILSMPEGSNEADSEPLSTADPPAVIVTDPNATAVPLKSAEVLETVAVLAMLCVVSDDCSGRFVDPVEEAPLSVVCVDVVLRYQPVEESPVPAPVPVATGNMLVQRTSVM